MNKTSYPSYIQCLYNPAAGLSKAYKENVEAGWPSPSDTQITSEGQRFGPHNSEYYIYQLPICLSADERMFILPFIIKSLSVHLLKIIQQHTNREGVCVCVFPKYTHWHTEKALHTQIQRRDIETEKGIKQRGRGVERGKGSGREWEGGREIGS